MIASAKDRYTVSRCAAIAATSSITPTPVKLGRSPPSAFSRARIVSTEGSRRMRHIECENSARCAIKLRCASACMSVPPPSASTIAPVCVDSMSMCENALHSASRKANSPRDLNNSATESKPPPSWRSAAVE